MTFVSAHEVKRRWLWREGQATVFFVFMRLLLIVAAFVAFDGWEFVDAFKVSDLPTATGAPKAVGE